MVSENFTITNKSGLHMRPAQVFAAEMNKFSANVIIKCGGKDINAKGMMGAGIKCGAAITVVCEGADEQAALDAASALIASGFGEK